MQPDNVKLDMDSSLLGNNGDESSRDQTFGQHSSPAITTTNPSMPTLSAAHDTYKILGVKGPYNANETIVMKPRSSISSLLLSLRSKFKRVVWKWHGRLIPLLHWQDWVETRFLSRRSKASSAPPPPKELFVNLRVLWNKAISSLDPTSPVYEGKVATSEADVDRNRDTVLTATSSTLSKSANFWWSYRLLPPTTRWMLSIIPSSLFPRWFHANIELRTAYLNRAIDQMIDQRIDLWEEAARKEEKLVSIKEHVLHVQEQTSDTRHQQNQSNQILREGTPRRPKIRLVILGAGYDTRSIRLLQQGRVDQVWEFDLPPVMESKRWLLQRRGLWKPRIPFHQCAKGMVLTDEQLPSDTAHVDKNDNIFCSTIPSGETKVTQLQCIGLDLNQPDRFRSVLGHLVKESTDKATSSSSSLEGDANEWYTIVISEALFLYLEPDIPAQLLTICQNLLASSESSRVSDSHSQSQPPLDGSLAFCFADRLLEIPLEQSHDMNAVQQWFGNIGWTLVDWLPKEGATRQMGISRPM
ncbi:MAG: hypothetical protein SGBAC_007872 [Bacillariaceae sp.]